MAEGRDEQTILSLLRWKKNKIHSFKSKGEAKVQISKP